MLCRLRLLATTTLSMLALILYAGSSTAQAQYVSVAGGQIAPAVVVPMNGRPALFGTAEILLEVPRDASVLINNQSTTSAGRFRFYRSEPLRFGESYAYNVEAVACRTIGGQQQFCSVTRNVSLMAGQRGEVRITEAELCSLPPYCPDCFGEETVTPNELEEMMMGLSAYFEDKIEEKARELGEANNRLRDDLKDFQDRANEQVGEITHAVGQLQLAMLLLTTPAFEFEMAPEVVNIIAHVEWLQNGSIKELHYDPRTLAEMLAITDKTKYAAGVTPLPKAILTAELFIDNPNDGEPAQPLKPASKTLPTIEVTLTRDPANVLGKGEALLYKPIDPKSLLRQINDALNIRVNVAEKAVGAGYSKTKHYDQKWQTIVARVYVQPGVEGGAASKKQVGEIRIALKPLPE